MGSLTSFALQTAIVLVVEYMVYKMVFAGTTLYRFNRAIIMSCYLLALISVPIVHLTSDVHIAATTDGTISIEPPISTVGGTSTDDDLWSAIPILYLVGVSVMLIWTAVSYARLLHIVSKGSHKDNGEYILVTVDREISPFSWGKYVIVSKADADNPMVLTHELAHIRNHHIVDLCVAPLFVIFNWFNPAAYLMRDELSAVHEYEADEQVLASGANAKEYQMLLIKKTVGAGFQAIANSLNHSQLKNRLTMMMKTESKSARRLLGAVMLPAAIGAAFLTDIPAVAGVIQNVGAVNFGKVSENPSDSQEVTPIYEATLSYPNDVVESPEVPPVFKGGEFEMFRQLAMGIQYPVDAAAAKAQGRTVVGFVVNTDGTIANVEVTKSSGNESLDTEAVRAVSESLSSGWIPGRDKGREVACKCELPVVFRLK